MKKSWYFVMLMILLVSPASAYERSAVLSYDVYVGGIKVVEIGLEAGIGPKKYSVDVSLKEVKFFSIFFSWKMRLSSEGKITEGYPVPRKASANSRWKGKTRLTNLEYDEFGALKSTKISPKDEEGIRSPVTDQMKRGTRDLATALLYLLQKLDRGENCSVKVPIFDGKRAFLIKLLGGEVVKLGSNRLSAFKGDALKCNFVFKKLGGYRVDSDYAKKRFKDPMNIWFGRPFPKFLYLPIRMELETSLGWLVAHLTKAEFTHLGTKSQIRLEN